jgi:hypothetical protein
MTTTAATHDVDVQAINALHELTLRVNVIQRDISNVLHELDAVMNKLADCRGLKFNGEAFERS